MRPGGMNVLEEHQQLQRAICTPLVEAREVSMIHERSARRVEEERSRRCTNLLVSWRWLDGREQVGEHRAARDGNSGAQAEEGVVWACGGEVPAAAYAHVCEEPPAQSWPLGSACRPVFGCDSVESRVRQGMRMGELLGHVG